MAFKNVQEPDYSRNVTLVDSSGNAVSLPTITSGLTFGIVTVAAAAGDATIIAKSATQKARLHKLYGHMSAAGTVAVNDLDGGAIIGAMPVAANGCVNLDFGRASDTCPITSAVNKGLKVTTTVGTFTGIAVYSQSTT